MPAGFAMAKSFIDRLLDTKDKSVDEKILFTLIGVVTITLCGIIISIMDYSHFSLVTLGSSYGVLFTGSGAHAIAQGWQDKLTPPEPPAAS